MKRLMLLLALAAAGCSLKENPQAGGDDAKSNVVAGTLAVDIRQSVTVTLTPSASSATTFDGDLAFGEGDFQLFDAGTHLHGTVTAEAFPEAALTMYVATFAAPAHAGPCGSQPITLQLSLTRRGTNARVGGGLTAYCGAGKTSGIPARVFRLTGDLPLP